MRAFVALLGRRDNHDTLPCMASGATVPHRWVARKKTRCTTCGAEVGVRRKQASGPQVLVLARHRPPPSRGFA